MNGYLKAQKQYDAQLPPDCEDEDLTEEEKISKQEAYEAYLERKQDEQRDRLQDELYELRDREQFIEKNEQ